MIVKANDFHQMKGHVMHGCQIISNSGTYTLKNHIRGWMIHGEDGLPITGYLSSANEVEYFVVNGLGQ